MSYFNCISKIFWPKGNKERGEFLRNTLSIGDESPFKLTDPRNHLEHFDERLERWYSGSELHNLVDNSIGGDESFTGTIDYMRYFNLERFVFRFLNNEYEIKPIKDAIQELLLKVEAKLEKPFSD